MTTVATHRSVAYVLDAVRTTEGAGFAIRRPFPTSQLALFDPFLLLDEMGPSDYAPGEAKGAPNHPHRGFETVTYMLSGQFEHRDSVGSHGFLNAGDVQWMTAGAGVVHDEMPSAAFQQSGGRLHGFQLWVNLPAKEKMIPPRYQDTPSAQIPVVTSADGLVRAKVIAGEALEAKAVIETRTPIQYLHLSIQPGGAIDQPVPASHRGFVYLFGGEGRFGNAGTPARDGQMVAFADEGDLVRIAVPADAAGPLELLLLTGVPLREPVARYGPFVMNTREEIIQAIEDFQAGRMGRIEGIDGRR